jgi:MFS family permease
MGSCCYAPTKKDFLWWYWLLLVSIVGIPMLAAVFYVARGHAADDEARRRRGRTAAWIFWTGTAVIAIPLLVIVSGVLRSHYGYEANDLFWLSRGRGFAAGYWTLVLQFFASIVAANGANEWTRKRKRWYVRISLLVFCVAVYLVILVTLGLVFERPAINVMQFLVCMLPAHYWGGFKDLPDERHAWKALVAFVVAASLFFFVSYVGEDFARWVCGPPGRRI